MNRRRRLQQWINVASTAPDIRVKPRAMHSSSALNKRNSRSNPVHPNVSAFQYLRSRVGLHETPCIKPSSCVSRSPGRPLRPVSRRPPM